MTDTETVTAWTAWVNLVTRSIHVIGETNLDEPQHDTVLVEKSPGDDQDSILVLEIAFKQNDVHTTPPPHFLHFFRAIASSEYISEVRIEHNNRTVHTINQVHRSS